MRVPSVKKPGIAMRILPVLGVLLLSLIWDSASARQCPYGYERQGVYCVPIAQKYRDSFRYDKPPGPRVYGGQYESRRDSRVDSRVGAGGCPPGYAHHSGGCLTVRR
jgi:hypothetical protein